jgi:Gluconolactonase
MWVYDYDIDIGALSNWCDFVLMWEDSGFFDGSIVDVEGGVWNALVIGGDLICYVLDGSVDCCIGMLVKNITSVVFGGPELDEIYVILMVRVWYFVVYEYFVCQVRF